MSSTVWQALLAALSAVLGETPAFIQDVKDLVAALEGKSVQPAPNTSLAAQVESDTQTLATELQNAKK